MKNINEFLFEKLNESKTNNIEEAEESIKTEKDFREAARAKFEEVFGDDLDKDKMKKTIDGLLEDNKDLVENGKWGELIGILNQSFTEGNESNK